jgi:hypothetical protein
MLGLNGIMLQIVIRKKRGEPKFPKNNRIERTIKKMEEKNEKKLRGMGYVFLFLQRGGGYV